MLTSARSWSRFVRDPPEMQDPMSLRKRSLQAILVAHIGDDLLLRLVTVELEMAPLRHAVHILPDLMASTRNADPFTPELLAGLDHQLDRSRHRSALADRRPEHSASRAGSDHPRCWVMPRRPQADRLACGTLAW